MWGATLPNQPNVSTIYTDVEGIRNNVAVLLRYVTNHGKLRPNKDLLENCAKVLSADISSLRSDNALLFQLYDCNERLANLSFPATASTVLQAFEAKSGLPRIGVQDGSGPGKGGGIWPFGGGGAGGGGAGWFKRGIRTIIPILLFGLFFASVSAFISLGSSSVNIRTATQDIRRDIAKVLTAISTYQQSYADAERSAAQLCFEGMPGPTPPQPQQPAPGANPAPPPKSGSAQTATASLPSSRAEAQDALSKNACYANHLAINLNFGNLTFTQSKRSIRQLNTEIASKIYGLCKNNDFVTLMVASYIQMECTKSISMVRKLSTCVAATNKDPLECGMFTPSGNASSDTMDAFILLSMFDQISSIFTFYFVPFLIGALGAGAFVLRLSLWQLDNDTFDRNSPLFSRYVTRIGLGGLTGLIAGVYFETQADQSQGFPLPLIISAFLMGYSVEMAFGIFDYWIQTVRKSFSPNKTEVSEGTNN